MNEDAIYRTQKLGRRVGYGQRPALLIIDFQQAFTDPNVLGGEPVVKAIANTVPLLAAMRRRNYPIAHGRYVIQDDGADLGPFGAKVENLKLMTEDAAESQIVDAVKPLPGEFLVRKKHSSCFFGTHLASWLISKQVDTLVVAGCSTSGCVRASVVDACAFGFRTIVVEDCCGDRGAEPHRVNLFDMDQKYADVVSLDAILRHPLLT